MNEVRLHGAFSLGKVSYKSEKWFNMLTRISLASFPFFKGVNYYMISRGLNRVKDSLAEFKPLNNKAFITQIFEGENSLRPKLNTYIWRPLVRKQAS